MGEKKVWGFRFSWFRFCPLNQSSNRLTGDTDAPHAVFDSRVQIIKNNLKISDKQLQPSYGKAQTALFESFDFMASD